MRVCFSCRLVLSWQHHTEGWRESIWYLFMFRLGALVSWSVVKHVIELFLRLLLPLRHQADIYANSNTREDWWIVSQQWQYCVHYERSKHQSIRKMLGGGYLVDAMKAYLIANPSVAHWLGVRCLVVCVSRIASRLFTSRTSFSVPSNGDLGPPGNMAESLCDKANQSQILSTLLQISNKRFSKLALDGSGLLPPGGLIPL